MKVCVVGGIFAKSSGYQRLVTVTPETVLADGLRSRGHEVFTASHRSTLQYADFDIVHVHHLARGAVAAALDRSATPLVLTMHNDPLTRAQRCAYGYVLRRSDAIVDISVMLAADRAKRARRHNLIHRVIAPGTPSTIFPMHFPSQPGVGVPWRLLYVGQLIPMKRVDLLLTSLQLLSGRYLVHLDLVYHNDAEEARLKELATRLHVADCVTFRGAVPQDQLYTYYHRAHAVVLPSDSDFVPSVLTEAMMCGTSVVATTVGGIADQVGSFGVLVPPGDALALADGIANLFEKFADYSGLATEMAATARHRFSVREFVSQHERLYETLCAERARGSRRSRMAALRSAPMWTILQLRTVAWRRGGSAGG